MTLSGTQLQETARDAAARLEHVSRGYPFTPHLEVWKTPEKVFLIVADNDPDLQIITVKADLHHADALRRDHESITPGRYLDKSHWISVGAGPGVTKRLVEDFVLSSHDLVTSDRTNRR
ncbi:MmcQ/YjbR family DNA-binding protein [Frigoribacterium sp. CFBP 13605]|uniref:MmcQ/YjbR family DNA-binding protein n=1 Tax=Frigoribacterium sp. CFBP 13605 TaxID=2774034 RepID=UPI0019074EB1|nr:MmcQ/YjbR family DNA-binding protein [Frigoribacterium sp. CFBP 13605]MBD8140110.1 MmcQ/YjbR family DNA-binding protein [Frigoribacterium sp. CFBP 13605]